MPEIPVPYRCHWVDWVAAGFRPLPEKSIMSPQLLGKGCSTKWQSVSDEDSGKPLGSQDGASREGHGQVANWAECVYVIVNMSFVSIDPH